MYGKSCHRFCQHETKKTSKCRYCKYSKIFRGAFPNDSTHPGHLCGSSRTSMQHVWKVIKDNHGITWKFVVHRCSLKFTRILFLAYFYPKSMGFPVHFAPQLISDSSYPQSQVSEARSEAKTRSTRTMKMMANRLVVILL